MRRSVLWTDSMVIDLVFPCGLDQTSSAAYRRIYAAIRRCVGCAIGVCGVHCVLLSRLRPRSLLDSHRALGNTCLRMDFLAESYTCARFSLSQFTGRACGWSRSSRDQPKVAPSALPVRSIAPQAQGARPRILMIHLTVKELRQNLPALDVHCSMRAGVSEAERR